MYFEVVSQCVATLRQIDGWFDKAESQAAAKKFDVDILASATLAPDMKGLSYQVQSACDYVKSAAGWLSGETPPRHEDFERTIAELRERVRKTVAFAEGVTKDRYADAAGRKVRLSWAPGKVFPAEDYLLQMTIPNVYFHLSMVYAILRNNGVDVGKMDFLGKLRLIDEA